MRIGLDAQQTSKMVSCCCQVNSNRSHFAVDCMNFGGKKFPPFGKCGGSFEFESGSCIDVAFRAGHSFTNGLGINGVGLASLDVGLHIYWGDPSLTSWPDI